MKILAFDTSSRALAVAILEDDQLLAETCLNIKKNHSVSLMPTIDFLMSSLGLVPADLDRIAVAVGPGSYTGLRVAVATAKTLAYTLAIDLVGVSSLYALAAGHQGLVVPLIDARRQQVYAGFYDNGRALEPDRHQPLSQVLDQLEGQPSVTFVGEVAAFVDLIRERLPQAELTESLPSAYQIGLLGRSLEPVNPHSLVPSYLKRVEAEEIWLEKNEEGDHDSYIQRV